MANEDVTAEERDRYGKFVFDQLDPYRWVGDPPPVLYHYTTGATLIEMLRTQKLWTTQIGCMNDYTELLYATNLLLQAVLKRDVPDDLKEFHERVVVGLSNDERPSNWWYIACLSQLDDDLSQWRAYGGGEGGCAVGFDSVALKSSDPVPTYLLKVNYEPKLHAQTAEQVAQAMFRFYEEGLKEHPERQPKEWTDKFLQAWGETITFLAPIMKNEAFKDEEEWRLIRQINEADIPNLEYRQKSTMMTRHLPIKFDGSDLLPIKEIVVGPVRHPVVSLVSVNTMLRTRGYPANGPQARLSSIPFQMP